ncbi:hypothetical protein C0J52_02533 [Blattella germanica]|nr:hypothetical protein C0J52_02533 [Blattella germanica]
MLVYTACFFALVVYHAHAGGTPNVKLSEAKPTCENEDFIADFESSIDEPTRNLNMKYRLIKDIPPDADCETMFFKQSADGKDYEQLPIALEKENCCEAIFEEPMYKKAMENQNLPKECPIKAGTYSISNMKMDDPPDDVEAGMYMADFKMTQKDKCLYGMQTYWNVTSTK